MEVVKRDGRREKFDYCKVLKAVKAAGCQEEPDLEVWDGIPIEKIQDQLEHWLMTVDQDVAIKFIRYRHEHALARRVAPPAIQDYILHSKYALPGESWDDVVDRWADFLGPPDHCVDYVRAKKVLPSMRSLQFAGDALADKHCRMYNCSYTAVDRLSVFKEIFYLLLCGCGVGFSVEQVDLGPIKKPTKVEFCKVKDSIEGWARAVDALIKGYRNGTFVEFDYSAVRPAGSKLSSGGKAPGHLPLRRLIEDLRRMLDKESFWRPILAHDVICRIAEAVLSGGIRRSSLLSLFDVNDHEMLTAKYEHDWSSPRAMANNSARLDRSRREDFDRLMKYQRYGEPGFFFGDGGVNPCGEIVMKPREREFGFCNLTEINGSSCSEIEFHELCRVAAIIGTYQAQYTDMPFLEKGGACAERDALLGVSITGIAENDIWHEDVLARGKEIVKITNAEYAGKLGIKVAVRATTIKPSGTASLLLGTSSGIHPHHARRYWRRVTANPLEPVAQEFRKVNPHMVEVKPNGDWCLTFPMEGNTRDWDVFKMAIHFQKYWSDHNVSATVPYTPDMDEIIWENRHNIGAMAFLPVSEDTYPYMPREEVRDLSAWARVIDKYRPVDYCSGRTVSPGCDSESCTS